MCAYPSCAALGQPLGLSEFSVFILTQRLQARPRPGRCASVAGGEGDCVRALGVIFVQPGKQESGRVMSEAVVSGSEGLPPLWTGTGLWSRPGSQPLSEITTARLAPEQGALGWRGG